MNIISLKFSPIFRPNFGEEQKKKKGLPSNLVQFVLCAPKTKGFAYHLCAQIFSPTNKGGAIPQFCVLIYANYTMLATQREGMAQCPPKYVLDFNAIWITFRTFLKLCERIKLLRLRTSRKIKSPSLFSTYVTYVTG